MALRQARLALGALERFMNLSCDSIMRSCSLRAPGVGRPLRGSRTNLQGSWCAPAPLLPQAQHFMATPPHPLLRLPRHLNLHTSSSSSSTPSSRGAVPQHSAFAPSVSRSFSMAGAKPQLPQVVGQLVEFEGMVTSSEDRSAKIEVVPHHWDTMRPHFFSSNQPPLKSPYRRRSTDCGVRVYANPQKLRAGQSFRVTGTYIWSEYYGLAVKLGRCEEIGEVSEKAIRLRLESVPNIGPKTAEKLLALFGVEAPSVLDAPDAVDRLLKAGYAKTLEACRKPKRFWDAEKEANRQGDFLPSLGLKPQDCRALQQQYGQECEAALRSDPYLALLRPSSIDLSLRMADEVAANLGLLEQHVKITAPPNPSSSASASQASIDSSSPSRGAVAMVEALLSQASQSGNSFVTWSALERATLKHLEGANNHLLKQMPALSGSKSGTLPSPEQSSLDEEGEDELDFEDAAHTLPPGAHSNKPQLWASILMGLRRVVMEVHTADPLRPPLPMSQPHIPTHARAIPASTLGINSDGGQSKVQPFPGHAIAYLDLLHKAEVEVAERLSQMLLAGQTSSQARRLQALEALSGGQAPGSEEERRLAMVEADASAVQEALRLAPLLSDRQRLAVQLASHAPVMLLTGAAGCGKTFVTQTIVAMWQRQGKRVLLCAPTGRAAQVLQERVVHKVENGSNINATTIHRMLGYRARRQDQQQQEQQDQQRQQQQQQNQQQVVEAPTKAGQQPSDLGTPPADASVSSSSSSSSTLLLDDAFEYNHYNRLDADAVLVDEASMLDVQLKASLLRALPEGCQLVMVGDPHQLLPVGPGCVLQDAISSRAFPQVHLDEIFRQAKGSNIVQGAHEIKLGRSPSTHLPNKSLKEVQALLARASAQAGTASPAASSPGSSSSSSSSSSSTSGALTAAATAAAGSRQKSAARLAPNVSSSDHAIQRLRQELGADGLVLQVEEGCNETEVASAVLAVVEGLGQLGVWLAEDVQVLSPTRKMGLQVGTEELNKRLQPIMNPLESWQVPSGHRSFGRMDWRERDRVIQTANNYDADVYNGDLGTIISLSSKGECKVEFAPRPGRSEPHIVSYSPADRIQLVPAWATTVHKAQGGQFPVVVMPLHEDVAPALLNRKLLYTGVTRAQRLLLLISTKSALEKSCYTERANIHNSLLAPRLVHMLLGNASTPVEGSLNGAPVPIQKDLLHNLVPAFTRPRTSGPGLARSRTPRLSPAPSAQSQQRQQQQQQWHERQESQQPRQEPQQPRQEVRSQSPTPTPQLTQAPWEQSLPAQSRGRKSMSQQPSYGRSSYSISDGSSSNGSSSNGNGTFSSNGSSSTFSSNGSSSNGNGTGGSNNGIQHGSDFGSQNGRGDNGRSGDDSRSASSSTAGSLRRTASSNGSIGSSSAAIEVDNGAGNTESGHVSDPAHFAQGAAPHTSSLSPPPAKAPPVQLASQRWRRQRMMPRPVKTGKKE